jgi:hypothetical protein
MFNRTDLRNAALRSLESIGYKRITSMIVPGTVLVQPELEDRKIRVSG